MKNESANYHQHGHSGRHRRAACPLITIALVVISMMLAECSPSVRYTRHRQKQTRSQRYRPEQKRPPQQHVQPQPPPPSQPPPERQQPEQTQPEQTPQSQQMTPPIEQAPQDHTRRAAPRLLETVANSYLGTPYKYGGMSRKGMDCSGFVTLVFREVYDIKLPRSSSKMWNEGVPVTRRASRPGDLIFFRGGRHGAIDHVGIYMGRKRFIHSSTSKGVIYSSVDEEYYKKRFAGLRRII